MINHKITAAASDFANLTNALTGQLLGPRLFILITGCYLGHGCEQHCMWTLMWQQKPHAIILHCIYYDHAAYSQLGVTNSFEVKTFEMHI